jgi:PAS domain S-box-containing protein
MASILIVDDEEQGRRLLARVLERGGHDSRQAASAAEARTLLRNQSFELILCDVCMPGESGLDLIRDVLTQSPEIAVVMASAHDDPEVVQTALDVGAYGYVLKPFKNNEILIDVSNALRRRSLEIENRAHLQRLEQKVLERTQTLEDTVERLRLAERVARESEERFRKIFDEGPLGMATVARDYRFVRVNNILCKMLGYTQQELVHLTFAEITHPEDAEKDVHLAEQLFRGEIPYYKMDKRYINKNGQVLWATLTASVSRDKNGDPLWGLAMVEDISQRKREEEELASAHEAAETAKTDLVTANRQLEVSIRRAQELAHSAESAHTSKSALLAAITSILIGVDENCRITEWNSVAERTFSRASAEVMGYPLRDCGIQWDWPLVAAGISQCLIKAHPTRVDDIRYKRPDGKEGFLGITLNPIKGSPGGFLLLGTDVTERRFMEAQLRQAQKLESIGQLAAGIAHEINTPTQYVSDNIRFLKDSFRDGVRVLEKYGQLLVATRAGAVTSDLLEEVEEVIQAADLEFLLQEIPKAIDQSLEGTERVGKIVRSMKEFAYPGGKDKASADLNKAIESTITVARNEWKYVAEMVRDFDPNLPLVPCLLGDLNQVILNLIVNAAHAITEKLGNGSDLKGTITISTRREEDWAVIRVSDTGMGIPEHVQPRIFDPFFTTKEVGKGTGQGLAISHSVIEKHSGTIGFETCLAQGTTFVIRLPVNETGGGQEP